MKVASHIAYPASRISHLFYKSEIRDARIGMQK